MSTPKLRSSASGFTLIELLVGISLILIITTTFLVFFKSAFFNYLGLQSDATNLTSLDSQDMRIASVVRGLTDITSASANDLVIYAYFYPSDTYVSLVHYYLQTTGNDTQLLADVTPMTANPPTGTPITGQKKTYTVIDDFYQASGTNLFTYLDENGAALSLPIADLETIKGIQVNLATNTSGGGNQAIQVQVSLRNRKTNL
jgi:prepilin-type N-terminal cleavage/methylation domain-containing protein